jgi:hypothetical protein
MTDRRDDPTGVIAVWPDYTWGDITENSVDDSITWTSDSYVVVDEPLDADIEHHVLSIYSPE